MSAIGKIQIHQVLISLLIGVVIGVSVQRCAFQHFGPPRHGDMKKHMLSRLSHDLHLSAEQKAKVEAVFEAKRPKMKALRAETRPQFEAIHKETQAEIRVLLSPEQQTKFDAINAKREARFRDREKRRGD